MPKQQLATRLKARWKRAAVAAASGAAATLTLRPRPALGGRLEQRWLSLAFVRFLLSLGIEPVLCPPRRPDLKPLVERCIRTLKHECLWAAHPAEVAQAERRLTDFRQFYNRGRANQALSWGNRPPYEAFPQVPILPSLSEQVDPDSWLQHYHGRLFRRRVAANGSVTLDKYRYAVGRVDAGQGSYCAWKRSSRWYKWCIGGNWSKRSR
jgi:Integrase core domain